MSALAAWAGLYLANGAAWCLFNSQSNYFQRHLRRCAVDGRLWWVLAGFVLATILWLPGLIILPRRHDVSVGDTQRRSVT